jgi:hypothetical protein
MDRFRWIGFNKKTPEAVGFRGQVCVSRNKQTKTIPQGLPALGANNLLFSQSEYCVVVHLARTHFDLDVFGHQLFGDLGSGLQHESGWFKC